MSASPLSPRVVTATLALLFAASCSSPQLPTVSVKVLRAWDCPKDASVTIDEQFIGPLGYVAKRGVRVQVGTHRLTVERDGYFPFDASIVATKAPVRVKVVLWPVPE